MAANVEPDENHEGRSKIEDRLIASVGRIKMPFVG